MVALARSPLGNLALRMLRGMSLTEIVSVLYAAGGIAACLFYLPQLRRLAREAAARRAMSLLAWGGWTAVGVVTLLYAWVVAGAAEMVVVAAANLACQAMVFGLAAGQAVADRRLRLTAGGRRSSGAVPPPAGRR